MQLQALVIGLLVFLNNTSDSVAFLSESVKRQTRSHTKRSEDVSHKRQKFGSRSRCINTARYASIRSQIEDYLTSQQPNGVLKSTIQKMVKRSKLRENFVVVVTGATGGIGGAVCDAVLQLGGLIVAVDISEEALLQLQKKDEDRIKIIVSDFTDLNSVSDAANEIVSQVSQVDIILNNAGIAYNLEDDETAPKTKQGYDFSFQINYLSHFLLIEKLLPRMDPSSARIVHVTSGLHLGVDGSDLIPNDNNPAASRGSDRLARHNALAYGNSKLGQIWHSAALNKKNVVTSVCACPSWAATGIAGDNEDGRMALEKFAFPTKPRREDEIAGPAVKSILNAMFLPRENLDPDVLSGKKIIGNAKVFDSLFPKSKSGQNNFVFSNLMSKFIDRVDMAKFIAYYAVLTLQRWYHDDLYFQDASAEGSNEKGHTELYDWSKQAVSAWLSITGETVIESDTIEGEVEGDDDLIAVV